MIAGIYELALVRIARKVPENYNPFGWNDEMEECIGEVRRVSVIQHRGPGEVHNIILEGLSWSWCEYQLQVWDPMSQWWREGATLERVAEQPDPPEPAQLLAAGAAYISAIADNRRFTAKLPPMVGVEEVPQKETPKPEQLWTIESVDLDAGKVRSSNHRRTEIRYTPEPGSYARVLLVENDLMSCCGAAQLWKMSQEVGRLTTEACAELCAHLLNAGVFGTHVRGRLSGYPAGDFFFLITDEQKENKNSWAALFIERFDAKEIFNFRNQAHGPYHQMHMFHMDLMQWEGVLVTRDRDVWVALKGVQLDPEGIFADDE